MMNCKICLSPIQKAETHDEYHDKCLSTLLGSAEISPVLPFTSEGFYQQRSEFSRGMSISGVQEKLSAKIDANEVRLTQQEGIFILKPTPPEFPELAMNEHLSMRLADIMGIDTPPLGLLRFKDSEEYCYIIRRFDRDLLGNITMQMEDMMQLTNLHRENQDSKYNSNYGDIGSTIHQVTNKKRMPIVDYFIRLTHSFIVGNGDLHMKNISMQKPVSSATHFYGGLTPLYDVVNSHIYNANEHIFAMDLLPEGISLPSFETRGFETGSDILQLGEFIGIPEKAGKKLIDQAVSKEDEMHAMIERSFMSADMKGKYHVILSERIKRLAK